MEILKLMENFSNLLRAKNVKETQIKMFEFYIKEYVKKQSEEETVGDAMGNTYEDLKKDTSDLLNIINIQIEMPNGKSFHCNDIFQKLLEKAINKDII